MKHIALGGLGLILLGLLVSCIGPQQVLTVTITSPTDHVTFSSGETIPFTAVAALSGGATPTNVSFAWVSSIDGQIGTGDSFTRSDLSVGTHTITVTANDATGRTATATVSIEVTLGTPLNVNPSSGAVHTSVTITGADFGASQGASTVTSNGKQAIILSWSDASITARVPIIATPKGVSTPATVIVTVNGTPVGSAHFTVVRGILFSSDRDGNLEIYVMNPDGSGQTNLSNNSGMDGETSWSPDGTGIAFTRNRDVNSEIYVMNADGSGQVNLSNNPALDGLAAWSPDGTKIAFTTRRDGNLEIYVMNTDGSGQTNISHNAAEDLEPSWSPNGTKLAFVTIRDGNNEIYVMNADGSGQTNITHNAAWDASPAWSPDETKIAFTTYRGGSFEIYVMNANGSGQRKLSDNAVSFGGESWSPGGTKIAFTRNQDSNFEIYVMNPDGSGQVNLTSNPSLDTDPTWRD